ncbi:hypothetical protein LR48_Vigan2312s000100 [Vigna angularis]|nr:hypothetical protein LR48_Vigan2312s000100 [Vigna angularis]
MVCTYEASSCHRRALSRLGKVFTPNTLKKAAAPVMSSKMERKSTSKLVHTEERSSCTSTRPPSSLTVQQLGSSEKPAATLERR